MSYPVAKQLKSGAWTCRVRVNGEDVSITKQIKKEAEKEAYEIKIGIIEIRKHPVSSITVGEVVDRYIQYKSGLPKTSPSTIRGYTIIRRTRFPKLMMQEIGSLDESDVQFAIDHEQASEKTIKNAWYLVHAAILWETKRDLRCKLPKVPKNDLAFLTADEIGIFVKAIYGTPIELPALLGLHSLRRSEIEALRWRDIDQENGIIRVCGSAVYNEQNKLVYKETTKTSASRRDVTIVIPRLLELVQGEHDPDGLVSEFYPNTLQRMVNRICMQNNLPEIGTHGLRRSFASLGYRLRIPEKVIAAQGGWDDLQTMHNFYIKIGEKEREESINLMKNFYSEK